METFSEPAEREGSALQAMCSTAMSLGIPCTDVRVLRSENNVVATINDTVVAKAIETARDKALRKEAAVISALDSFDEVVMPAYPNPGPFEAAGWTAILLERLTEIPDPVSARDTQLSLRYLHAALARIDLALPSWTDQLKLTIETWEKNPLPSNLQSTAENAYGRYVEPALAYDGSVQTLHGDAWSGQLMNTTVGLRWIDLETAATGPIEWDLAGFDDADAYGPFNRMLWSKLRLVRSWSVAVWSNFNASHSPDLRKHVDFHIRRLADALSADRDA